jgi:hypothetical protein
MIESGKKDAHEEFQAATGRARHRPACGLPPALLLFSCSSTRRTVAHNFPRDSTFETSAPAPHASTRKNTHPGKMPPDRDLQIASTELVAELFYARFSAPSIAFRALGSRIYHPRQPSPTQAHTEPNPGLRTPKHTLFQDHLSAPRPSAYSVSSAVHALPLPGDLSASAVAGLHSTMDPRPSTLRPFRL